MKAVPADARLCRYSVDRGWMPILEGLDSLSKRELQVLKCYGAGLMGQGVARQLGISVKTVHAYRARIFDKLKLSTTGELIHYALFNGLVENQFSAKAQATKSVIELYPHRKSISEQRMARDAQKKVY